MVHAPSGEILEQVGDLVSQVICAVKGCVKEVEPDLDLFANGWFDSISKLHLVLALQDEFGVVLDETEVSRESLQNVRSIAMMIERKKSSPDAHA